MNVGEPLTIGPMTSCGHAGHRWASAKHRALAAERHVGFELSQVDSRDSLLGRRIAHAVDVEDEELVAVDCER